MAKVNPRKRPLPEGYLCFSLDGSTRKQRSAFSDERRGEVHDIRKKGACLRCQLLKKSCSKGDPCTTCVRAATKQSASRSLAWMDCIRPSLNNVTIFGSRTQHHPNLHLGGLPVLQYLAHGDVDLKFDIPFQWNIDELSTFVAGWLVNDHDAPRASMVGIMSSASLLSVISDLINPDLAQAFKALIYTSSLIFNSDADLMSYTDHSPDVKILRHCGHRLLQHLETVMRPTALARLSKQELYAMFLLLLGTIISSKYVCESLGDLSRLSGASIQKATSQQTQPILSEPDRSGRGMELVRLLSHHMVFLGHTSGLLQEGAEENLIADLTSLKWRRKAIFTWESPGDSGARTSIDIKTLASANICRPKKWLQRDHSSTRHTERNASIDESRLPTHMSALRPWSCAVCKHTNEPLSDAWDALSRCQRCATLLNLPPILKCASASDPLHFDACSCALSACSCAHTLPKQIEPDRAPDTSHELQSTDFGALAFYPMQPSSPLDFNVADFDPTLPTLDSDPSLFGDLGEEDWACSLRMPTPPPDAQRELEQQLKKICNQYTEFQDSDVIQPGGAAQVQWCSQDLYAKHSNHSQPFEVLRRRLLL